MNHKLVVLSLLLSLSWSHPASAQVNIEEPGLQYLEIGNPDTTYEKFLPLATSGDAEIQNLLGYMYFFGEGVMQDYDRAYDWFRSAAENNNPKGQMNLALFHSGVLEEIPQSYLDPDKAARWISRVANNYARQEVPGCTNMFTSRTAVDDLVACIQHTPQYSASSVDSRIGAKLYAKFCAGCHGFNGIAYYVNSPSFALGERLHKSDFELEKSIHNGITVMPSWGDKLDQMQIRSIIAFIRGLPGALEQGIAGSIKDKPDIYFRFRPLGETGNDWIGADPVGSR